MNFTKLKLDHKDLFRKYTAGYINAESSFTNIMMWDNSYFHAQYAISHDTLVLKYTNYKGQQRFSMPYGKQGDIAAATRELCKYCEQNNLTVEILDANRDFVDAITADGAFDIEYAQNRDYQEYVYLSQSLAELSGKELHSKKNHVNKFKSLYEYKFVPLDSTLVPACLENAELWLNEKYNGNTDEYAKEIDSIHVALNNFEYFGLFGGAIFAEDDLVAFTVGEELTDDVALVHIEKANINYKGAFAAINYEFANYLQSKYKYLNREEDMGIEGLRKAKMSYKPAFFTDKYRCIIKEKKYDIRFTGKRI